MQINDLIQEIKSGRLDKKQVFKEIREGLKSKKRQSKEPATGLHIRVRLREKIALLEEAKTKGVNLSELVREKVFA